MVGDIMDYQLHHGDCVEKMKLMADESIDLTVCSPPYDNIRTYNGNNKANLFDTGKELFRLTKDGGVVCVVLQDSTKDFGKSLTTFSLAVEWVKEIGFKLFECVIYHRNGRPGAWWNKRFRVDHEYILIFIKGNRPKTFDKELLKIPAIHAGAKWHGTQRLTNGSLIPIAKRTQADTKCRGTVWKYETSKSEGNKIKNLHPAPFPDALARDLIYCFSEPNNTVLDPFVGSGTTLVEAIKAGRKGIGIELNQDYLEICKNRIAKETPFAMSM